MRPHPQVETTGRLLDNLAVDNPGTHFRVGGKRSLAEIVTGEAVVLDIPIAAFPTRLAAVLIDLALQYFTLFLVAYTVGRSGANPNAAALGAIFTVVFVLLFIGYPTIFETVSRGKTLGKMALGVRVVSDDGGPERFRQALIRALAGLFEFTILAPVALLTSLVSARGKRLGDIFAGTCVVQERVPRTQGMPAFFASVPPPLTDWARTVDLSGLSDVTAEAAASYLRRFDELRPAARDELGVRLATAVAAQVSPPPPPGTPPSAYLAAITAVRHERESAKLAAMGRAANVPTFTAPTATMPTATMPTASGPAATQATVPVPTFTAPTENQPAETVSTSPSPTSPLPTESQRTEPAAAEAAAVEDAVVEAAVVEATPSHSEPAEAPRFAPPA